MLFFFQLHPFAVLAAIGFVVYEPLLSAHFLSVDDPILVTENADIVTVTAQSVMHIFHRYDPELYIPITFLSYQLDSILWGLNPAFFHAVNILLHIVVSYLVYCIGLSLRLKKNVALLCAILFLVHPLNTETVSWISARKDLLSMLFALCSFYAYIKYTTRGLTRLYVASLFCFLLSVFSKPTSVLLPFVLIMYDCTFSSKKAGVIHRDKILFFIVAVITLVIGIIGKRNVLNETNVLELVAILPRVAGFVITKVVAPFHLTPFYPLEGGIFSPLHEYLAYSTISIIIVIFCWRFRKNKQFIMVLAMAFLFFIPTVVNYRKGIDWTELYLTSDRYAYGIIVSLSLIVGWIAETRKKFAWVLLFLVIPYIALTHYQSSVWKTDETLFTHYQKIYPAHYLSYEKLGLDALRKSQNEESIILLQKADHIHPSANARYHLGLAYLNQKDFSRALQSFRSAVLLNPNHIPAQINIGVVMSQLAQYEDALQQFLYVSRIAPNEKMPLMNAGLMHEVLGNPSEAIRAYSNVLIIDPNDTMAKERMRALRALQ